MGSKSLLAQNPPSPGHRLVLKLLGNNAYYKKQLLEDKMKIQGGCYCGEIRYKFEGDPEGSLQCHCRECQYGSGGHPAALMIVAENDFIFTQGTAKTFQRPDLDKPVTRYFCPNCGTGIASQTPARPKSIVLKVGTFDDPSIFEPKVAIFIKDKQKFHHIPNGLVSFEDRPS